MMLPTAATAQPTLLMGIVNVTPDSFSDGGRFEDADRAVAHALLLVADGAHIVDVGGESTRPGAASVDTLTERERVEPVVTALVEQGIVVSIDTRHAATAAWALAAGATIVNDVTGFGDPAMRSVTAEHGAVAVINHMPNDDPRTMQQHAHYGDVVSEVVDHLARRADECARAGITSIVLDPGIGFGKTTAHNLALLAHLDRLVALGHPVLVGASRKRFVGELGSGADVEHRLGGSIGVALAAVARGASMLRVHDVAEHDQALRLWHAIERA